MTELEIAASSVFQQCAPSVHDISLDLQTAVLRSHIAFLATMFPMASIGTCTIDGTDLHFKGKSTGLEVCCGGSPTHCWRV